jgi:hypothetical protein
MAAVLGDGRSIVGAVIDFLFGHPAELFYVVLGIGVILYSSVAKRMSFEGDVAVKPEDRKTYVATPKMRLYGIALGMLPLLYGLYHLLYPVVMDAGLSPVPGLSPGQTKLPLITKNDFSPTHSQAVRFSFLPPSAGMEAKAFASKHWAYYSYR